MQDNKKYKEELIQKCLEFSREVICLVNLFPRSNFSSRPLADQLIRSATSVGANVVEAQACDSRKDFKRFLVYALKSANETKYWLELSKDLGASVSQKVPGLLEEAEVLSKILGSTVSTLNKKQ